jgi:hypothetical protein
MGLFDLFTGDPAQQAAQDQRNYFDKTSANADQLILSGQGQSLSNLGTGYGSAKTDLTGGYNTATGAVNSGADSAHSYLGAGYGSSGNDFNAAQSAYDPLKALSAKYGGATTMALNGLGVNGQAGTDAAQSAFSAGPAYNFNMDQGLDAINRRRAAGGMLNSGNADRDAQTFGAGLASNQYNTWMGNLLGFTNPELSATSGAASGVAGVNTARAGMDANSGIANAGVDTSRGQMLASLASQYGTGNSALDVGQGKDMATINTNAMNSRVGAQQANAAAYSQSYKNAADAQMAGSSNLWNLGMSGAKLLAGMPSIGGATPTGAVGSNGWLNPDYLR